MQSLFDSRSSCLLLFGSSYGIGHNSRLLHLYSFIYFNVGVFRLTDDQNVADSVPASTANGTWKQGRHLLRQLVYHSAHILECDFSSLCFMHWLKCIIIYTI